MSFIQTKRKTSSSIFKSHSVLCLQFLSINIKRKATEKLLCTLLSDNVEIEICALLRYNAASSGNTLPTFRDNVSVTSSRVKKSKKTSWPLKMRPIRCPETSVKYYHSTLRNIPEERRSHQHRGGSVKLTHRPDSSGAAQRPMAGFCEESNES
jgi:hypothetical protein